jgi:hypothetical protein
LIVSLVLVAAIGASGLWVGYALRSSTEQQIRLAAAPVVATGRVGYQTQQLDPVTGTVGSVASYQYVPPGAGFLGPVVVTQQGAIVGQPLLPGKLIAGIDDLPVFGLPLRVSLWRDLALNDSGTDVFALNTALSGLGLLRVRVTNVYSASTAAAVAKLFKGSGFVAPSAAPDSSGASAGTAGAVTPVAGSTPPPPPAVAGDFLPMSSVATVASDSLLVTQADAVGTVVAATQPVVTAAGPVNTIATKVDILHQQKITVGTVVSLQAIAGADLGQGTITAVGGFSAGDTTKAGVDQLNGYPITISFTPPSAGATPVQGGDQVTIQFPKLSDRALAVPTVAVRQSIGSAKVMVKQGKNFRLVAVTPMWQQGGWTGVAAGSGLTDGETVVVSGK